MQPWVRPRPPAGAGRGQPPVQLVTAAVRAGLRPQSVAGGTGSARGHGAPEPAGRPVGQSVPGDPGGGVAPDRGCARRLPRPARFGGGSHVPRDLRLADRTGTCRDARPRRPTPASAGARPRGAGVRRRAGGRAAPGVRQGRPARRIHPSDHLYPPPTARGRRALLFDAAQIRDEHASDLSLAQFKSAFRQQFMLVLLDPDEAVRTLPELVAKSEHPAAALAMLKEVVTAGGELPAESMARLARIAEIYEAAVGETKDQAPPAVKRASLKVADGGKSAAG